MSYVPYVYVCVVQLAAGGFPLLGTIKLKVKVRLYVLHNTIQPMKVREVSCKIST